MQQAATTAERGKLRCSCGACAPHICSIPAGLDASDLIRLDANVRDKRVLERGKTLFRQGDAFHSLYVVRAGSLKTFAEAADGDVQVLGFHFAGELAGIDALADERHQCTAEALEHTLVCELPYARLQRIARDIPSLQHQFVRIVSSEIVACQAHLVMMGKHQALERLAIFLSSLAERNGRLSRDTESLVLTMSRQDIASYLGLVIETVSRLFARMEQDGILEVDRKSIRIVRPDRLATLCGNAVKPSALRYDSYIA
ncbi:CRP/FNR family transcriptional regulator [Luteibacter rhizovicinus]|uniref:CRP-like protein Clp n=1 Tax=Luteibacter rhizovicinus TaxID=242606 RepID=A0A4V2W3D0_9GAMM|nr:cyclic nucleotide-binding domain-containing protein [Luteibacter rhizovicinus]TCV91459.1 CRP/FNR family transcriptional regulator [Luteibacter rhizovicinus]